ncbi:rhamnulokinase family protein [Oceanispirochaeta sp.]|jgi:rhamnulokinase|uniref:rhamnulokinase n=1 Tax=Oceanispirochaeta sp. TaxID=2035350 RepID=UPI002612837A|nr:rhamnulokinase family protein [Oceanispirochaeta sp.]MDA3958652.1 rhamnulokinase [Oceanispirochaeta sp.]
MKKYIAVDLGASNGRVIVGNLEGFEATNRFPTWNIRLGDSVFWDILAIFNEIKKGIKEAVRLYPEDIVSIGIDTWGVDYGLLDKNGNLIGNPYMYRDSRTDSAMEEVLKVVPRKEIYERTGIQFAQFNTLYQLWAMKRDSPEVLAAARHYLSIPDLLSYWLTGVMKNEFTHASTTQLLNPYTGQWDVELMKKLGLPSDIFEEIVPSGTVIGPLAPHIAEELNAPSNLTVVAVGAHDTASAVAAVPVEEGKENLFLSSGTWSLLGVESDTPVINDKTYGHDLTNEGTVSGTTRLLKNIMGMWILQESKRFWDENGEKYSWDELSDMARSNGPVEWHLNPNDQSFFAPSSIDDPMPERIGKFCVKNGWKEPASIGEYVRGIFQGLAETYASTIEALEDITGKKYDELYIVGGGCRDSLLCELTAEISNRTVLAGPGEATALGNIMIQILASGEISSIQQGRDLLRKTQDIKEYQPKPVN